MNPKPETADQPGSNGSPSAPKVLVVEDDVCSARLYTILLQKEGYQVQHCPDGEAALQTLSHVKFDAVVLDLMMPKMDGIQVLKALRASPGNPLCPVIILTAARLKVVEEEAFRYGAKLYLDKSQTDKLLEGLRKIMSERMVATESTLRMAAPAPIQELQSRYTRLETPVREPQKPAAATVLGRLFRAKSVSE